MPDDTKTLDPVVFAGGEPDPIDSEAVSGDRGDTFVDPEANQSPATPVVDHETPKSEPQAPETPAAEPAAAPEPEVEAAETETAEPRIPKSRFDQVNERRKIAEQRARELEEQLAAQKRAAQPAVDFDFDAAEQRYMEAVVDGEFDKAKSLRAEIRAAERQAVAIETSRMREQASEATLARLDFDKTVAELQTMFPVYDPEGSSYDDVLTSEALEIHQGLMATGKYSPAQALRKAAETVAKANGVVPAGTAPKAPARETKPDYAKKAAAANAQPPKQVVGSKGDSVPNVRDMSEEEFSALPESTLRKLRGDLM
jgi:hypothetical protein